MSQICVVLLCCIIGRYLAVWLQKLLKKDLKSYAIF